MGTALSRTKDNSVCPASWDMGYPWTGTAFRLGNAAYLASWDTGFPWMDTACRWGSSEFQAWSDMA